MGSPVVPEGGAAVCLVLALALVSCSLSACVGSESHEEASAETFFVGGERDVLFDDIHASAKGVFGSNSLFGRVDAIAGDSARPVWSGRDEGGHQVLSAIQVLSGGKVCALTAGRDHLLLHARGRTSVLPLGEAGWLLGFAEEGCGVALQSSVRVFRPAGDEQDMDCPDGCFPELPIGEQYRFDFGRGLVAAGTTGGSVVLRRVSGLVLWELALPGGPPRPDVHGRGTGVVAVRIALPLRLRDVAIVGERVVVLGSEKLPSGEVVVSLEYLQGGEVLSKQRLLRDYVAMDVAGGKIFLLLRDGKSVDQLALSQ